MLFRKKREMIDIRKLHKGGVVRLPQKDIVIPQNKDGFIELGASTKPSTSVVPTPSPSSSGVNKSSSNNDFFGFMDKTPTSSSESSGSSNSSNSFSSVRDGYSKREVDARITELDNKIYKLEQRLELLERKAGVGENKSSVGPMGW